MKFTNASGNATVLVVPDNSVINLHAVFSKEFVGVGPKIFVAKLSTTCSCSCDYMQRIQVNVRGEKK
jgi:hypothetical protein